MTQRTVRLALVSDAQALCTINRSVLGYDYPLERTKARLSAILQRPTDRVFVVCMDSRVVGYAHASDYENTYSDSMKNLMALAVEDTAQGLGLGRMLLEAIESWAQECGCEAVRLVSGNNRQKAHAFYQHCGYTLRKEQKNFIKRLR